MDSIDKLRKWADGLCGIWLDPNDHSIIVTTCDDTPPSMDCVSLREHVNGILDAIEREVEQLRDREYKNGREDAGSAAEFADRLKAAVDEREDVTLFGVDYMPLPLDADGIPIHVGDVMEVGNGRRDEVRFLTLNENGWAFNDKGWVPSWSHHRTPTVEDVLREFAEKMAENTAMYVAESWDADERDEADAAAIAECAAKLTLRGDE